MAPHEDADDTMLAWSCASNLRLHGVEPGTLGTDVGSRPEPRITDRREALVERYARQILLELRADYPRILALRAECRQQAATARSLQEAWRVVQARRRSPDPEAWPQALRALSRSSRRDVAVNWALGARLADHAAQIMMAAGAARDAEARARLLAATELARTRREIDEADDDAPGER